MYYADEMKREEPLGQINVQTTERLDNVLKIGHWTLKFETLALCKAWKKTLVYKEDKPKQSQHNRKRYVRRRRQSIGDQWEDSEEDEETAHFERVMELLKRLQ